MKILFWPVIRHKAQYTLRYLWPATHLSRNGYDVQVKDPRLTEEYWSPEMMADDMAAADVVVAYYPKTKAVLSLVQLCEEYNKKLVVDCDDFSFGLDPSNPAYGFGGTSDVDGLWHDGVQYNKQLSYENQTRFMYGLSHSDAVTVTQGVLADMYAPLTGDGKTWVCPNSLDLDYYKPWDRRRPEEEIRIGWQGGSSHYGDLQLIIEPMKQIKEKYPNVTFVVLGQGPKLFTDRMLEVESHPWVDTNTYQLKLGSLDLDIGLCPIADTKFNIGKSNLKMLEYGAYRVPSICSKIPDGPYNSPPNLDMDGVDRLLVEDNVEDEWYKKIEALVTDVKSRREIGNNARTTVEEVYNIRHTWRYWADCYDQVHQGILAPAI